MIEDVIDKVNLKEFIAIFAGNVAGTAIDSISAGRLDSNQLLAVKTVGGFAATYLLNTYAERQPGYSELIGLAGLATTALAAQEPSRRVSIEVSKRLGKPVVVASKPVARPTRVSRGVDVGVAPTTMVKKPEAGVSIGR